MGIMRASWAVLLLVVINATWAWADPPRESEGPQFGPPETRERGPGPGGPPDGRPGRGPRMGAGPLFMALDLDHDGTISAEELAGAESALKSLDKNGDGQLTRDEIGPRNMGPPPGRRPGGRSGPPGNRGPQYDREPQSDRGPQSDRPRDGKGRREVEGDRRRSDRERPEEFRRPRPPQGPDWDRPQGSRQDERSREDREEGRERPRWNSEDNQGDRKSAMQDQFLKRVMQQDANSDGQLQGDEIPERLQARMDTIDGNHDGILDEAEIRAAAEQILQRFREGGRAGGQPRRRRERPEPEEKPSAPAEAESEGNEA